jgi:predicted DNA-binding protein
MGFSGNNMKNIKPHKGGRTLAISVRLSPEEKKRLDKVRGSKSVSDFIAEAVKNVEINVR